MNLRTDHSHRTHFRRKLVCIRYAMDKWHEKKMARPVWESGTAGNVSGLRAEVGRQVSSGAV